MKPSEHANLISIFSWVLAGIQGLVFLLFALYILIFGIAMIAAILSPENPDKSGLIVLALVVGLIGVLAAFGLVCVIANFRIGRRLRSSNLPTQRSLVVMAILNFLSLFCGGLMVWPFGIALGVYEIWFAMSDQGKAFLTGHEFSPLLNQGLPAMQYREPEPHRWQ